MKIFNRTKDKPSKKQRAAGLFKGLVGTKTHAAAYDIITSPKELADRRKEVGEHVDTLKSLTHDELLQYWGIPQSGVKRLRRTLMLEIVGLLPLLMLCGWGIVYGLYDKSAVFVVGSIATALICLISMIQRHRWLKIVSGEPYHTFREYVLGREA